MTDKIFITYEAQIKLLESRNLKFKDRENAKYILMNNSYYGIINSYKDLFVVGYGSASKTSAYEDDYQGSYFEDLLIVYDFDKNLASVLYKYLTILETTLKSSISYALSEHVGFEEQDYFDKLNYQTGIPVTEGKHSGKDSRYVTLLKMKNCRKYSGSESIIHYKKEHQTVPPWILIPNLSLGTIYELYRICPPIVKIDVYNSFLKGNFNANIKADLFFKSFKYVHIYRNRIAHGSRIFNNSIESKNILNPTKLRQYSYSKLKVSSVKPNKLIGVTGLFYAVTILLSNRSTIKSAFIKDISNLFTELKEVSPMLYDRITTKHKIPDNLEEILNKI